MSVWNDRQFKTHGAEMFSPFDVSRIQPASYDMILGDDFAIQRDENDIYYDVANRLYRNRRTNQIVDPWVKVKASANNPFVLKPNQFALGTTVEYIKIPMNVMGRVEGKSSLGRIGLMVHVTAGYVDPGFEGQITLEFKNISSYDIQLVPGVPIGQISIHSMDSPAEKPYGSCGNHYQKQIGATPPR